MRYAALVFAVLTLASCRYFEDDAQYGYSRTGLTVQSAFTTADVRIITERDHPVTHQKVVCTEPSPDVAKAISTAFALSAQGSNTPAGTNPGATSASLGTGAASAEAVAELAGRSTALLGLRDGLFQACQAYANGAIGPDVYALIVSRYGQLMTTLFLGQDITGTVQPTALIQSPPVSVSTTVPGTNTTTTASAGVSPGPQLDSLNGSAPTTQANAAAAALTRMNEDYFNLDNNIIHTLSVACINDHDPAVKTAPDGQVHQLNPWLDQICAQMPQLLGTVQGQKQLTDMADRLVKAGAVGKPVDPTTTTNFTGAPLRPASNTPSKPAAPAAAKCQPMTIAIKASLVKVLTNQKYLSDASPNLAAALNSFENDHKLAETSCPLGQIGQDTLTVIQALAAPIKS